MKKYTLIEGLSAENYLSNPFGLELKHRIRPILPIRIIDQQYKIIYPVYVYKR